MDPTVANLESLRVLQIVVLTKLLHLCVPSELPHDQAMTVHRLRKRVCIILMDSNREHSWVHNWLIRKYTYLGHLVRRNPLHVARAAFLSGIRDFSAGRPGLWRTHLHWLCSFCRTAFGEQSVPDSVPENVQGIERALTDLAANRDAWHSQISKILTPAVWQVHTVAQTRWKNRRHCFNTRIPWHFNVGLSWIGDSLAFTWLDEESGFINFILGQDLVYEEVEMYIGHARMLHSFCSMSILLDQNLLDSYLSQLLNFHRRILCKFQVLLLFEVCPAKWLEKSSRLGQQS